jgi:hypothetical protein
VLGIPFAFWYAFTAVRVIVPKYPVLYFLFRYPFCIRNSCNEFMSLPDVPRDRFLTIVILPGSVFSTGLNVLRYVVDAVGGTTVGGTYGAPPPPPPPPVPPPVIAEGFEHVLDYGVMVTGLAPANTTVTDDSLLLHTVVTPLTVSDTSLFCVGDDTFIVEPSAMFSNTFVSPTTAPSTTALVPLIFSVYEPTCIIESVVSVTSFPAPKVYAGRRDTVRIDMIKNFFIIYM